MSFFSAIFAGKSIVTDRNAIYAEMAQDQGIDDEYSGQLSSKNAVYISTVFSCCRVLGEGLAQVPWKLMRQTGRTRMAAKDHPLYEKLALKPNRWQTSFEFREQLAWNVALEGNHYVFINRSGKQIIELYPFQIGEVTPEFNGGVLTYKVTANGNQKTFPAETIWHIKGPSMNGYMGLKAVKYAKEALGLASATEKASTTLHRNSVRPSGVYSVEGTLDANQYMQLSNWLNQNMSGANAGRPLILDRAAKWMNTGMSSIDAQTLETRAHQIAEICRYFRVSPIMIYGDSKLATYAGSSESFKAHLMHTLAPWYERIEQSAEVKLLTEQERKDGLYTSFTEEGMLRGTPNETAELLDKYTNGGIMTVNEARERLDLNPDPDPASDKLRIPANIVGKNPLTDGQEVINGQQSQILKAN